MGCYLRVYRLMSSIDEPAREGAEMSADTGQAMDAVTDDIPVQASHVPLSNFDADASLDDEAHCDAGELTMRGVTTPSVGACETWGVNVVDVGLDQITRHVCVAP